VASNSTRNIRTFPKINKIKQDKHSREVFFKFFSNDVKKKEGAIYWGKIIIII